MKKHILAGALVFAGLSASPMIASAQDNSWILDLQNQQCSAESRQTIADSVRQQIEDSIARATAAIQPPAALGDLSCLNDLMNTPLDMFSNVGGLLGSLQGGLTGAIGGVDTNISRQVCQFAAEKWGEVTEPLNQRMSELSGVGSDLWSNFDLSGNGERPTNRSSGSSSWTPDGEDTGIVDPDGNSGVDDDTSPIVEPEDDIPVRSDCTPVLEALQLCRAPDNTGFPNFGGGDR